MPIALPNVGNTAPIPPPPDSRPPHIIEQEKKASLLARARVVREALLRRNGDLDNQKPDKTYMWVNIREDRQTYFQAMGWTLCTDPEVTSPYKQGDNSHRRADVILYEIDREFKEALDADTILRGIEGIEQAETGFVSQLMQSRVPVYKPKIA